MKQALNLLINQQQQQKEVQLNKKRESIALAIIEGIKNNIDSDFALSDIKLLSFYADIPSIKYELQEIQKSSENTRVVNVIAKLFKKELDLSDLESQRDFYSEMMRKIKNSKKKSKAKIKDSSSIVIDANLSLALSSAKPTMTAFTNSNSTLDELNTKTRVALKPAPKV